MFQNCFKKTKDYEIKDLKYKFEKHDHEKILKTIKIDNEYYQKKSRSLKKNKVLLVITEILIGSASTISSSTLAKLNPSAGVNIKSSTTLLTSIAILITNEYISKLKFRCTKLNDWKNVATLVYEKTLKIFKVDKKLMRKKLRK